LHQRVNFAVRIFGKAVDVIRLLEQRAVRGHLFGVVVVTQSPKRAEVVVAVNINAGERGKLFAAINVAANHAQADGMVGEHGLRLQARLVRIFHDGFVVARAVGAGFEVMCAFANVPTVVAAFLNDVHFFPQVLADVAAPERAGGAVKTVTPRIAQAVSEDFFARAAVAHVGFLDERIIARDAVADLRHIWRTANGLAGVDINAEHFREQGGIILATAKGVVGIAAIAESEIQITIRAEAELAALVIAEGLRDLQDDAFGSEIGFVGVGGDFEFADDGADGKVERLGILITRIALVVIDVK